MIRVADDNGVRTIVLDRAEKRNALTPDMLAELARACSDVPEDIRSVVLVGEGRCLCAGFDLSLCEGDGPDQPALRALLLGLDSAVRAMRACRVPVVVAAHGAAIAGGCALLGGADVVVTHASCKLGYPVVRLGISPAVSLPFLTRGIAAGAARRATLDPSLIDGSEAFRIGLAHELVDAPENVAPRAQAVAGELAGKPAGAVAATRRWLDELCGPPDPRGVERSLGLVGTPESRELLALAWGKR